MALRVLKTNGGGAGSACAKRGFVLQRVREDRYMSCHSTYVCTACPGMSLNVQSRQAHLNEYVTALEDDRFGQLDDRSNSVAAYRQGSACATTLMQTCGAF